MTASCFRVPPLARFAPYPEMSPVDLPYLLLPAVCEVAVPLIIEDNFCEIVREFAIPPCSVSSVTQAASWSACNSRSGFVPGTMVALFTDDPGRDEGPLIAAGIVKRARKGGWQIIPGRGLTVINASEVAEKVTRDKAEAERKREEWNLRKRRQRDAEKAERAERMAAGVTQKSRGKAADVTRDQTENGKKPQFSGRHVTRDIGVTSRVTPQIDRSNQSSSGVGQIDARAREDAAAAAAAIPALCEATGRGDITEADALRAIGIIRERAKAAGKRIRGPGYYRTAILAEDDPYAELLLPPAPPPSERPADPVLPGKPHAFNPDPTPGVQGVCLDCPMGRSNRIHQAEPRQNELKVVV